jgi:hypothetical protein
MTGSKYNQEGNSSDSGEPDPGPYWRRMHRDWRFWVGAIFVAAALAIYVLSGNLAWVPNARSPIPMSQNSTPAKYRSRRPRWTASEFDQVLRTILRAR